MMLSLNNDDQPTDLNFDLALVAVGYEKRCRWITETCDISASHGIGLEFGFLAEGSYQANVDFFQSRSFEIIAGLGDETSNAISSRIRAITKKDDPVRIFIDISSMSREMIANVVIGINGAISETAVDVFVAYAPSKFSGKYPSAPIRLADPIKPSLAGWSARPERPLGAIFGLGCEPGLALGALQFLEPDNTWVFEPKGSDPQYDIAMNEANEHIAEIFPVTKFVYHVTNPSITRGRFEALLNALDCDFRLIVVPFGPKIFAWLTISTIVFTGRTDIGVWAFSSKEQAVVVDRAAEGIIVWDHIKLSRTASTTTGLRAEDVFA